MFELRGLVDILRRLVDTVRYRINRRLVVAGQAPPTPAPAAAAPTDSVLVATDLRVTYNHLSTAINDITVSVGAGEIVVMLGANGAGKTTTLRGITGFLPAENAELTHGEVRFNSELVNGSGPAEFPLGTGHTEAWPGAGGRQRDRYQGRREDAAVRAGHRPHRRGIRVGPEEINGFHAGFRESGLGGDDGAYGLDGYFRKQTVYLRY